MSDPFNEFGIFFLIFYLICLLIGFTYYFIKYLLKFLFEDYFLTDIYISISHIIGITFPNLTYPLFILFLILYLILYIFYLFIIYVVPSTGFITLFIPIRELLLAIPPLPLLINKGVFSMFDTIFSYIGGSIQFKEFFQKYFEFSKNNIIEYIRMFNPNIDSIIEKMENINNKNNNDDNNNLIENSKNNVDICINSQAPITTPDMNFINLFVNEIKNTKNTIKCNLNSIKTYIKT